MQSTRFVVLLSVCVAASTAAYGLQAFGVGTPYGSGRASATTTTVWVSSSGSATPMLFPAGRAGAHETRVAVLLTEGLVTCCWVGAPSGIDLGSGGIATDAGGPNGTGSGACLTFGGSALPGRWDARPKFDAISAVAGGSERICPNAVTNSGDSLYAPCRVDADCTSYGAGVCSSSPTSTQRQLVGMFLACEAASGTVVVHAVKEQVD